MAKKIVFYIWISKYHLLKSKVHKPQWKVTNLPGAQGFGPIIQTTSSYECGIEGLCRRFKGHLCLILPIYFRVASLLLRQSMIASVAVKQLWRIQDHHGSYSISLIISLHGGYTLLSKPTMLDHEYISLIFHENFYEINLFLFSEYHCCWNVMWDNTVIFIPRRHDVSDVLI